MLLSPFSKLSSTSEKKWTLILLFLLVVIIGLMRYFDAYLINSVCKAGIVSFEFAKDVENSKFIINSWNVASTKAAYSSLILDFLFLIVYASFIGLLIHKIVKRAKENSFISKLGVLLIWGVFLAALFDVVENIALLNLLSGNLNQVWSSVAYYFAILKFALIFACIIYILWGGLLILTKKLQPKPS